MATIAAQMPTVYTAADLTFTNYQVTDIPAYSTVTIDATNDIATALDITAVGVKLCAADGDPAIGVTMETIKANGGQGRVRTAGVGLAANEGGVTAGGTLEATDGGNVKTCAATKAVFGKALTTSADGDMTLFFVTPSGYFPA